MLIGLSADRLGCLDMVLCSATRLSELILKFVHLSSYNYAECATLALPSTKDLCHWIIAFVWRPLPNLALTYLRDAVLLSSRFDVALYKSS